MRSNLQITSEHMTKAFDDTQPTNHGGLDEMSGVLGGRDAFPGDDIRQEVSSQED